MNQQEPPLERTPYWQYIAIFLVPTVLYWINPNWCFQNLGHMDPWYYFGEFWHSARFENLMHGYPGERITWIAPGHLLVHLFGYVTGVMMLHWLVFLISLFSVHYILKRLVDGRTALAGALLLGSHPFFIASNGWDYPEGLTIALVILSLALLINTSTTTFHGDAYVILSSMVFFGAIYTYILWLILLPAYALALFLFRCRGWPRIRSVAYNGLLVVCGGMLTTGLLSAIFRWLGATSFFYRNSITVALSFVGVTKDTYGIPHWQEEPSWLVFPPLAFALLAIYLGFVIARHENPGRRIYAIVSFYAVSFLTWFALSLRIGRLLTPDHDSVFIAPLFVVIAIVLLRVPTSLPDAAFYATIAIGFAIAVSPLRQLHSIQVPHFWMWLIPAIATLIVLQVTRLMRPKTSSLWVVSIFLLCGVNFILIPPLMLSPNLAWRMTYNGRDISERVARAVQVICDRIPPGRLPMFWINNIDDPRSAEYRAVMCAFVTHGFSMWEFPKVDPTKHYDPGTPIILVTEKKDVVDSSSETLAKAGMPVKLISQDLIDYGAQPYWVTCLLVVP